MYGFEIVCRSSLYQEFLGFWKAVEVTYVKEALWRAKEKWPVNSRRNTISLKEQRTNL